MKKQVRDFIKGDSAAVTVDWVILTGFVVTIVLAVIATISPDMEKRGATIVAPVTITSSF